MRGKDLKKLKEEFPDLVELILSGILDIEHRRILYKALCFNVEKREAYRNFYLDTGDLNERGTIKDLIEFGILKQEICGRYKIYIVTEYGIKIANALACYGYKNMGYKQNIARKAKSRLKAMGENEMRELIDQLGLECSEYIDPAVFINDYTKENKLQLKNCEDGWYILERITDKCLAFAKHRRET